MGQPGKMCLKQMVKLVGGGERNELGKCLDWQRLGPPQTEQRQACSKGFHRAAPTHFPLGFLIMDLIPLSRVVQPF